LLGLRHRGFLFQEEKHIAHLLRKNGYSTHIRGLQHVTNDPAKIGYDTSERQTTGSSIGPGSSSALAEEFLNSQPEEPFLLTVGFVDTHLPFPKLDENDDTRYVRPPAHLPDCPETREDWAGFRKAVNRLDAGMGVVFDALEKNGYADNTLVICTTDHGVALPRMKCTMNDAGIGVMLIMRGPGGFSGGKISDSLVSHVDVFPTICDLIGAEKPEWLEGSSLLPIINGEKEEINDQIFSEVTFHASYEPQRCVRTKRYKYIRRWGGRETQTWPNIDASHSKTKMMESDYGKFEQAPEHLYDVVLDPQEFRNLIDDPNHQDILADMRSRLDAWMKRTNDPLLAGEVPLPIGAKVTLPDEIDPTDKMIHNTPEGIIEVN